MGKFLERENGYPVRFAKEYRWKTPVTPCAIEYVNGREVGLDAVIIWRILYGGRCRQCG